MPLTTDENRVARNVPASLARVSPLSRAGTPVVADALARREGCGVAGGQYAARSELFPFSEG